MKFDGCAYASLMLYMKSDRGRFAALLFLIIREFIPGSQLRLSAACDETCDRGSLWNRSENAGKRLRINARKSNPIKIQQKLRKFLLTSNSVLSFRLWRLQSCVCNCSCSVSSSRVLKLRSVPAYHVTGAEVDSNSHNSGIRRLRTTTADLARWRCRNLIALVCDNTGKHQWRFEDLSETEELLRAGIGRSVTSAPIAFPRNSAHIPTSLR